MPEPSKCRSCGADILWVRGIHNNLMPLDAEPHEKGNVVIKDGIGYVVEGTLWEPIMDGPRHRSHYNTCAQAAAWQKGPKS